MILNNITYYNNYYYLTQHFLISYAYLHFGRYLTAESLHLQNKFLKFPNRSLSVSTFGFDLDRVVAFDVTVTC